MVIIYLTCANTVEASIITKTLLEAKLVACVRTVTVSSEYLWKGSVESNQEELLMMESIAENFDSIDVIVKKLHSYETYVLTAVPVLKTTPAVEKWLTETLSK